MTKNEDLSQWERDELNRLRQVEAEYEQILPLLKKLVKLAKRIDRILDYASEK